MTAEVDADTSFADVSLLSELLYSSNN